MLSVAKTPIFPSTLYVIALENEKGNNTAHYVLHKQYTEKKHEFKDTDFVSHTDSNLVTDQSPNQIQINLRIEYRTS